MAFKATISKVLLSALPKRLGALRRDRSGTTAVEFALLGIPFFAIIGAILETALLFFSGQVLESAVRETSRLILTGQATSFTAESFKQATCEYLYGLIDCDDLKIRVTTIGQFADAVPSSPIDPETGKYTADWDKPVFQPGGGSSIVMVEAYYKAPLLLNFGSYSFQNTADGKRLLSAVRIFQNEP